MGMSLKLLIVQGSRGLAVTPIMADNKLNFERDYALFAKIDNAWMSERGVKQLCSPKPLPPGLEFMVLDEEKGWARETQTLYGEPLTYVTASELAKLPDKNISRWNKAVLAMMKALPAETPVVLWWH